jgi:hypothetical protein
MAQQILTPPTLLEMMASDYPDLLFQRLAYVIENVLDFTSKFSYVFYSGFPNRTFAEHFCNSYGFSTLEMTSGGKYLDGLDLFNNNKTYKDGPPITQKQASELWDMASRKYALTCKCPEVYAFIERAEPINEQGVLRKFFRVELPVLLKENKNIETIFFVNSDFRIDGAYEKKLKPFYDKKMKPFRWTKDGPI